LRKPIMINTSTLHFRLLDLQQLGAKSAHLVGSVTKGTSTEKSDLDIFVVTGGSRIDDKYLMSRPVTEYEGKKLPIARSDERNYFNLPFQRGLVKKGWISMSDTTCPECGAKLHTPNPLEEVLILSEAAAMYGFADSGSLRKIIMRGLQNPEKSKFRPEEIRKSEPGGNWKILKSAMDRVYPDRLIKNT